MLHVTLDATPLDTMHRDRGIGRYAQGLLTGFEQAARRDLLSTTCLTALRLEPPDAPSQAMRTRLITRRFTRGIMRMWSENLVRMDAWQPSPTHIYHASSMEGVARKTPWVATCHDLIPMLMPGEYLSSPGTRARRAWWPGYVRALTTRAARVIAISHHVKSTLTAHGVPEAKIDVIHHGLDPFWSEPAHTRPAAQLRALAHEPYLLFIGGYDSRKNFDGLLLSLSLIPASRRPHLLAVGGRSKKERAHTQAVAKASGVRVRFLDYIDDLSLRFLYQHALALAFPSVEEGWGFPIVEAMAAGTPVICADFGSMSEAAAGAGIAVDVRQADALSHAIMHVCEDEALRARHSELGCARAAELTWLGCAQKMLKSWHSI